MHPFPRILLRPESLLVQLLHPYGSISSSFMTGEGEYVLRSPHGESKNIVELSEVTGLDHAVCFVKNQEPQVLDLAS